MYPVVLDTPEDALQRKQPLKGHALAWGAGLYLTLVVLALLGPTLKAPFGLIDEEQVASSVRGRPPLSLPVLREGLALMGDEANGRTRPGFWLCVALETFALSDRVAWWRAASLGLVLSSMVFLYLGCLAWVPPLEAAVCAGVFFVGPQNIIWIRLLSAEAYAVPFACYALMRLSQSLARGDSRPARDWRAYLALAFAGSIKESFIPLLPAALGFTTWWTATPWAWRTRWSGRDRIVLAGAGAILLLQVSGVACALLSYGHVYHQSLAPIARLRFPTLWAHFFMNANRCLPLGLALAVGLGTGYGGPRMLRILADSSLWLVLGILGPQMLLYSAEMPGAPRYLTPGNLSVVLVTLVGFRLLRSASPPRYAWLSSGLAVLLLLSNTRHALASRIYAERHLEAARSAQKGLDQVARSLAETPEESLVLCSAANTYECAFSVPTFLRQRLGAYPSHLFLVVQPYQDPRSPLTDFLDSDLREVSRRGGHGFQPLASLPPKGPRLTIIFEGVTHSDTEPTVVLPAHD